MKYLAICRHTFHKAPPAEDRHAALQACEAYGEIAEPYLERGGWLMHADHVNGYTVYNVDSPEQLWDLVRKYPGSTIEWGNEWEIYPLIDNDFYWEHLIAEAKQAREAG